MTEQKPIFPSSETVKQWINEVCRENPTEQVLVKDMHIAIRTAEWVRQQNEAETDEALHEPEKPSKEKLEKLADDYMAMDGATGVMCLEHIDFALAALTRWGRPVIQPVPVAERPWERKGWCDAEGRCWWGRVEGNPGNPEWFLAGLSEIEGFYEIGDWTVLLPHHALPAPTQPTQQHPK